MRLIASLGLALLGLGACAHLPAHMLLDVDGSIVELKKKLPPEPEAPSPDAPQR
jgi:hypothetical protein